MNKKMSKRQRDIKSKLMAAICMLLVSSIMMVSSTYAWFTLSTAPEVTGIQTAVGANGNLEMALLPTDGLTSSIQSAVGDSMSVQDATLANITWGNLVDLTDDSYGLQQIVLYPSALNVVVSDVDGNPEKGNPTTLGDALLQIPTYGADGRVSELAANTVTSTYAVANSNFPGNEEYGVRAVGTASGMTERQLAYRNAKSSVSTNMAQAKNKASTSLGANGEALANIAVKHGTNQSATHTQEEVASMLAIVKDLVGAYTYDAGTQTVTYDAAVDGVLDYISDAYRKAIIAYGASDAATEKITDEAFGAFQSAVESAATLDDAVAVLTGAGATLPSQLTAPINNLKETKADVEEALKGLEALKAGGSDEIAWGDISSAVYKLADTDAMTVNDLTPDQIKTDAGINHMISTIGGGVTVKVASGGGVYADIADHCGDYKADITIRDLTYGSIHVDTMKATMTTVSNQPSPYLTVVSVALTNAGAPSSEGAGDQPITDTYGYVVDLAFRTNAAESNLLLQTEAVDRIYNDNGNAAETFGHGSTMTFASNAPGFTADDVRGLMECIRVVFFNGTEVLATAKLDVVNATVSADGITAKMYLYEKTVAGTEYIEATYVVDDADASPVTYKLAGTDETATHAKVGEQYFAATLYQDGEEWKAADADHPATHYMNTTTAGETTLTGTNAIITSLSQNVPQAVSVLVYLDGSSVTNADVANSAQSATGTMNLQFASSATLVPMEYTAFVDTSTLPTEAPATPEGGEGQG